MVRVLAIDFGEKRIGLAISSEDGKIAFHYKTIQNTSFEKAIKEIQEIVKHENVKRAVFGLPLTLKSKESESTGRAREFFTRLKKTVSIPVVLVDERFSTKRARKNLSFKKVPKEAVDQEAARILLEDYLRRNSK